MEVQQMLDLFFFLNLFYFTNILLRIILIQINLFDKQINDNSVVLFFQLRLLSDVKADHLSHKDLESYSCFYYLSVRLL